MDTQREKRFDYLSQMIWKYFTEEPKLTIEELAIILCEQLDDESLVKFIKEYRKELKK